MWGEESHERFPLSHAEGREQPAVDRHIVERQRLKWPEVHRALRRAQDLCETLRQALEIARHTSRKVQNTAQLLGTLNGLAQGNRASKMRQALHRHCQSACGRDRIDLS